MNKQFVDFCIIKLEAGDGGNGALAWRREAHYSHGGPFGGDGGDGGNIVLVGDHNLNNLFHLRNYKRIKANNGQNGATKICHGAKGENKVIKVPCGTVITDLATQERLCDIVYHNQEQLICKGGKGGKGNFFFKSSINQAPSLHERGDLGEIRIIQLEIYSIADVGLLGFPNAGKSTFLAHVSNAKPKIAPYPFTTLQPVLGTVEFNNQKLVFADIPGLVENAASGVGLGHDFLRHINRCKILIHLIDATDLLGLVNSYLIIRNEIKKYSQAIAAKPYLIAINKIDLNYDKTEYEKLVTVSNHEVFLISGMYNQNIQKLLAAAFLKHNQIQKQIEKNVLEINQIIKPEKIISHGVQIIQNSSGWDIKHPQIAYWIHKIPQNTIDNQLRLKQKLNKFNLEKKLLEAGAIKNDQIHAYGLTWSFLTNNDYD